jgi:hypothetical protein
MRCSQLVMCILAVSASMAYFSAHRVSAKDHTLTLRVKDLGDNPFANVGIGLDGVGGSPQKTDVNGLAELTLGTSTKPTDRVSLLIASSPPGMELMMIDPYHHPVMVPPFDDNTNNYVPITVTNTGDYRLSQSGSGRLAIQGALTRAAAKRGRNDQHSLASQRPRFSLSSWIEDPLQQQSPSATSESGSVAANLADVTEVSRQFHLPVEAILGAIRGWGDYPLGWNLLSAKTATYGIVRPFSRLAVIDRGDISFGIGDWSFRQCSLQRVFVRFSLASPDSISKIVGEDSKRFLALLQEPCAESAEHLSQFISGPDGRVTATWRTRLQAFGGEEAFERIEFSEMKGLFQAAIKCATDAGLRSELAVTFCFDLNRWWVDGRVLAAADQEALADSAAFEKEEKRPPDELEKLFIFVNRVGDPHNFQQESGRPIALLSRTLGYAIADGRSWYGPGSIPLEDLGLAMRDFETDKSIAVHRDETLLKHFRAGWFPSEPDRMAWHP